MSNQEADVKFTTESLKGDDISFPLIASVS